MHPSGRKLDNRTRFLTVTSATTLTASDSGTTYTNTGAAGAVELAAPQNVGEGVEFTLLVNVAQELRFSPGAGSAVYINGAKQTDNKYITANAISESIRVVSDENKDWIAYGEEGTWTVEA